MSYLKDLTKVQIGKENSWGSAATLTVQLMGVRDMPVKPIVEVEQLVDLRGSLAPAHLSVINKTGAELSVDSLVIYDDLPYMFNAFFGVASGTTSQSVTTYNFSAPGASVEVPNSLTVAFGDGTVNYLTTGVEIQKMVIKGETNKPLELSADMVGKTTCSGTMASLSDRSVTVAMGNDVSLFIDTFGGTIGATPITATAFKFEVEMNSNKSAGYHLGAAAPDGVKNKRWSGSLKLTLELTTAMKAFLDAQLAGTSVFKKLVRIKATNGTNIMQLDFAGTSVAAPQIFTDEDGVITLEVTLDGEYDSGSFSNWLKAQLACPTPLF
jgi:hypothetical protein